MQRRSGQNHPASTGVFLDLLHKLAVHILQPVALIHDDVPPRELLQMLAVPDDDVVSGDNNGWPLIDVKRIAACGAHDCSSQIGAVFGSAVIKDGRDLLISEIRRRRNNEGTRTRGANLLNSSIQLCRTLRGQTTRKGEAERSRRNAQNAIV